MWAGQLACEAFNYVLKKTVKQERPHGMLICVPMVIAHTYACCVQANLGDGYGFPSSHSQWMGYFVSFLCCHLYFRHRFSSFGFPAVDLLFRLTIYLGLIIWGGAVVYSR
jgi:dolichyldiphosphatase